jgi:tRNA nucleotidyltransferase (CCA-adding enzyme)
MNKIKNEQELINKVLTKLQTAKGLYKYVNKIVKIFVYNNYNFYFVGGTIRDILISIFNKKSNIETQDVDIVVETDDYSKVVTLIQKNLSADKKIKIKTYPQFLTLSILISIDNEIKRIDLSIPRKEEYPKPAVLPKVSVGTVFDDVYRRDFTINAVCIRYDCISKSYSFYDPFNGIKDIINKKIRILHEKSFIDDPTRILRGIRFAATLSFKFEPLTEKFVKEAIRENVISMLSETRLNSEFVNILKKGGNLYQVAKFFKKYKIYAYYINIKDLIKGFITNAKKIELEKIKDKKNKFYIRLFYLLEKVGGPVELLETNKIRIFKKYLEKLNISRDERSPIYDAVKIFANGQRRNLPKWVKIYLQVFNRKITKLPVKPSKLLDLGVQKEKIKPVILYILTNRITNLSNKKIKSIALKLNKSKEIL